MNSLAQSEKASRPAPSRARAARAALTAAALERCGFRSLQTLAASTPGPGGHLVHGDNLAVMTKLTSVARGLFRVAYLDPPYNTGRLFDEYDDRASSAAWAEMMRPRLALVRELLAPDGSVFVEIDEHELGTLLSVMDDVFGARNRYSLVTIKRSAATGHKAKNKSPVNVADYLVAYAVEAQKYVHYAQEQVRRSYDEAYRVYIDDPKRDAGEWTFRSLADAFARAEGEGSAVAHRRTLGARVHRDALVEFALSRRDHVCRFAQPRYEAIGKEARAVVDRSKAEPARVFVHRRPGLPDFIVRGGNRVLFLRDKVREREGKPVLVEPLTNVWDDMPFQGIAREGGVTFRRNKKPEALLERILAMSTAPGDWVLDPFVGSGTTAAVAHKLGRHWVGIDQGEHLLELAVPRLARVVRGEDPTGITKRVGFTGGGRVDVYRA